MGRNMVNSLIMQNRLISQAKSRSRAQSTDRNKVLQKSSDSKSNVLENIRKQAAEKQYGLSEADAKSKENYTAMKKAAESLKEHTKSLLLMPDKDWEALTQEEALKYKEEAVSEVTALIEDYNNMIKSMTEEGGKVNEIYLKQMKGYFQNAKIKLEELGITQNSDGTLSVDQELLNAASGQKLKEVFGTQESFIEDIGKRAENVISNAETNLAILNKSQYAGNYSYNRYGSDIFDMLTSGSRYNGKG